MHIKLPYQFNPRHYQHDLYKAFFLEGKKRLVPIWHRRAGKSKCAINFLVAAAMQRVGNYYHTFPELKQARRVIWEGIDKEGKRYLDHVPEALIKSKNNTHMELKLINGSTIMLAGADRYDSLMGSNPKGIIFDEYSLQNPMAWHYMRPILAENGGWAMFPFTPRGRNHGYDLYERNRENSDWFVQKLGADQTFNADGSPIINQSIIDEEVRSGMLEELIEQEFYCSFDAALPGAYYTKEMRQAESEGRIVNFPIDPMLPVYTFWDIGVRDSTSITFVQFNGNKVLLVAYYEKTNEGMEHYANALKDMQNKYGWTYAQHFAPHDIQVKEFGSGRTRLDTAASYGVYFTVIPQTRNKQDDIAALRQLFPRLYIHKDNCSHLKNALLSYHREYDQVNKIFKDAPKHDWASHPVDSLLGLAVSWADRIATSAPPPNSYQGWQYQA